MIPMDMTVSTTVVATVLMIRRVTNKLVNVTWAVTRDISTATAAKVLTYNKLFF